MRVVPPSCMRKTALGSSLVLLGALPQCTDDPAPAPAESFDVRTARDQVNLFWVVVDGFVQQNKRLPKDFDELIRKDASGGASIGGMTEVPKDPWSSPFQIRGKTEKDAYVLSFGPDKIEGTPDDIRSK